jgi:hypothetical protein
MSGVHFNGLCPLDCGQRGAVSTHPLRKTDSVSRVTCHCFLIENKPCLAICSMQTRLIHTQTVFLVWYDVHPSPLSQHQCCCPLTCTATGSPRSVTLARPRCVTSAAAVSTRASVACSIGGGGKCDQCDR